MTQSVGEKWFAVCNYFILAVLAAACIYPFLYVLSASISSADAVKTGKVLLFPLGVNFESYERVLSERGIWIGYANTIYYTFFGTLVSMALSIAGAYPLSKKRLRGRRFLGLFIVFTMMFNAGMIPFYLNLREMGLLNSRMGIILPFAISTFLVIIMRTFFQSIPEELEEASKMDGGSDWQILWNVYLPLSKPALATVGLFYAISRWNGYFWSMILLTDESKIPLQVLLNKLIVEMKISEEMLQTTGVQTVSVSQETVIYATIVVAILPMVVLYPFIQKYFAQGMMIGSLKE
ncbi:carbohydrate ABC transporter permease [Paenibacillus sp.]|uniref:carbohydrate ABC transporter permease n=1 Tax=Paenibacillus sp. TaxID=58172 RepID=UPI00281288DD|nr:carbohydrate ABC transporter permease [Paenibacillus sp.]